MANDFLTIADIVGNSLDVNQSEISDLLTSAPFFASLPIIDSSNGSLHKYTKETGAPVVGFRAENDGIDYDHSVDTLVTVTLKRLAANSRIDKAVADGDIRGADYRVAREAMRHLKQAFFVAEQQYILGTGADANGFTGFANSTGLDKTGDEMVIDGGSSAGTANSSVYLVRMEAENGVCGVMPMENAITLGETLTVEATGASGNYPAYYTPLEAWMGLQIGGARDIARICNLDDGSNKLTDAKLYTALELFPTGGMPNVILMTRRSRRQLQASRTATNVTGAPAPFPTEVEGVPIMTVESITTTEAVVAAS